MKSEDIVRNLLLAIGEDPSREGLLDTPKRVVKSWAELFSGYKKNPLDVLGTTFDCSGYGEMVICKDIEFYSTCEHHMLPFYGKIHIAYIPKKRVVGLSKLARLVDVFARRLQIQEQLTNQIATAIDSGLQTKGCMVIASGVHHCMCSRGVSKQSSSMVTIASTGLFKQQKQRQEFLSAVGMK